MYEVRQAYGTSIDWIPASVLWCKFLFLLKGKRLEDLAIFSYHKPFDSTVWKARIVPIW